MPKLLLADDQIDYYDDHIELLSRHGWRVITATNVSQALYALDSALDGIILDERMPDTGDGTRVLTEIRKHPELNGIPVFLVTAYDEPETGYFVGLGAAQFFVKPINPGRLLRILEPAAVLRRAAALWKEVLAQNLELGQILARLQSIPGEVARPDLTYLALAGAKGTLRIQPDGENLALRPDGGRRRFVKFIIDHKQAVFERDAAKVADWEPVLPDARSLGAAPIPVGGGEVAGVYGIESRQVDAFDYAWLDAVTSLANLAGTAIQMAERSRLLVEKEYWQRIPLLAAELGHRIATPLHVIDMQVDRLLRSDFLDRLPGDLREETRGRLKVIRNNTENISGIREDLRRASLDITTGRGPSDLANLIALCLDEFRPKLEEKQVDLESLPLSPLFVEVDATSLQYCVQCILSNALEAIERRRENDEEEIGELNERELRQATDLVRVDVTLDASRQCAIVRIADTGIGIRDQDKQRVFEPLFTTKRHPRLNGIGLSSVRRIVEKHGGSIEFRSEYGKGTTFEVLLPMAN